jgi:hypothetical protein
MPTPATVAPTTVPPAFNGPVPIAATSVTLRVTTDLTTAATTTYQRQYCLAVAAALNISVAQVAVTRVTAGSALMTTALLPNLAMPNSTGSSTMALAWLLIAEANSSTSVLAQHVALDTSFNAHAEYTTVFLCTDGSIEESCPTAGLPAATAQTSSAVIIVATVIAFLVVIGAAGVMWRWNHYKQQQASAARVSDLSQLKMGLLSEIGYSQSEVALTQSLRRTGGDVTDTA